MVFAEISLGSSAPSQLSSKVQSVYLQRKKISFRKGSASESWDWVTSISASPKSRLNSGRVKRTRTLGNLVAEEKFEMIKFSAWVMTSLGAFGSISNNDGWSLFSRWENPSTPTGGRSERTCYLACLLLFLETSHAWGGWISFDVTYDISSSFSREWWITSACTGEYNQQFQRVGFQIVPLPNSLKSSLLSHITRSTLACWICVPSMKLIQRPHTWLGFVS